MRKPTPRTYAFTTMYVGMGATLMGNAATADWSNPVGVVLAAFPALALFVTFEMVMRTAAPAPRKNGPSAARLRANRLMLMVPAVAIMLGSAVVSIGHLVELAQANGQTGLSAWITALLPDAMMLLSAVVIKNTPAPTPARPRTARRKPNPITAPAPALTGRRTRQTPAATPAAAV